jgi:hypothetical protein
MIEGIMQLRSARYVTERWPRKRKHVSEQAARVETAVLIIVPIVTITELRSQWGKNAEGGTAVPEAAPAWN